VGNAAGLSSEASHQQANHRHLDECFARLHLAFVVLGQSPAAAQPRETAFHYPPARLHAEATRARLALHDLQLPALSLAPAPLRQLFPAIRCICPNLVQSWREQREPTQELARANRVMDIRWSDVGGDGQAHRVDQEVALPALDAFVRVVAADAGRLFDRLDALTVHDGGARIGAAADTLPFSTVQRCVEQMPRAL
jgi:hypothetical protein